MDIQTKNRYNLKPNDNPLFFDDGKLSPDGKRLVYDCLLGSPENEKGHELRIIDIDGQNEKTLMQDKHGFYYNWSPDSKFIVVSGVSKMYYKYFILNVATLEYWSLQVPESKVKGATQPYWSIDGKSILFISIFNEPGTKLGLFKISLDGKSFDTITRLPSIYMGELSPDQKSIVFLSSIVPDKSPYTIGKSIVVLPNVVDDKSLYVFDVQTGNIRKIAKAKKWLMFPFWSPDNQWVGAKLVTNSSKDEEFAVWHIESGERRSFPLRYESTFQWWGPQSGTPPDCEKIVQEMLGPGEKLEALPVNSTSQK